MKAQTTMVKISGRGIWFIMYKSPTSPDHEALQKELASSARHISTRCGYQFRLLEAKQQVSMALEVISPLVMRISLHTLAGISRASEYPDVDYIGY